MFNNRFSFPFRVDIEMNFEWFQKHSSLIKEIYISPDIFNINMNPMNGKENFKYNLPEYIKFFNDLKSIDIGVCLVINNIFNPPDLNTIKRLIKKYDFITSVVVPDHSWLSLKELNIEIKNTVIMNPSFDDILLGKYNDFDIIYIHDDIIHNKNKYKELKRTGLKFGTVVNYSDCCTFCNKKQEHYKLINNKKYNYNTFCPTKMWSQHELLMKRNSIPTIRSEYQYYLDTIDIFKLQGRGVTETFNSAINIIEGISSNQNIFTEEYFNLIRFLGNDYKEWVHEVRNCGGNCLKCNFCDNIIKKRLDGRQ